MVQCDRGNTANAESSTWLILTLAQDTAGINEPVAPGAGDEWRLSPAPEAAARASYRAETLSAPGSHPPVQAYYLLACMLRPGVCSREEEPNNNPETANALALNTGVAGTAGRQDVDYCAFTASAGERLFLIFDQNPDAVEVGARLELLDPDALVLAVSNAPGRVGAAVGQRFQANQPGVYHLRVSGSSETGTPYRLLLIGESSLQRSQPLW